MSSTKVESKTKGKRKLIQITVQDQKREKNGRFVSTVDPANCPPGLTMDEWKAKRDSEAKDKYREDNKYVINERRREKRLLDQLEDALNYKKLAVRAIEENKPHLMPTKAKLEKAAKIIHTAKIVKLKEKAKKFAIAKTKHIRFMKNEENHLRKENKSMVDKGLQPSFFTPEGAEILSKALAVLDLQKPKDLPLKDIYFLRDNCPNWTP